MTDSKKMAVHVIASGSKGNCTAIEYGDSVILHDAGISCCRIVNGLKQLGISMERVEGVFISHEHSDHVNGLPQLLKQYDLPVYTREATWRALSNKLLVPDKRLAPITKTSFSLGSIDLEPFKVSHDAADPHAMCYYGGACKATVMTDTGLVSDYMLEHIDHTDLLVLEANYDKNMLFFGKYAPFLKQRVSGDEGHLSNAMAAQVLTMMKRPDFMKVVLAHRSENNNTMEKVTYTVGHTIVDAGIKIGPEMRLTHAQPDRRVSMYQGEEGFHEEDKN